MRRLLRAASDGRQAPVRRAQAGPPGPRGGARVTTRLCGSCRPSSGPPGVLAAPDLSQPLSSSSPGRGPPSPKHFCSSGSSRSLGPLRPQVRARPRVRVHRGQCHPCRCPGRCVLSSLSSCLHLLSTHASTLAAHTTSSREPSLTTPPMGPSTPRSRQHTRRQLCEWILGASCTQESPPGTGRDISARLTAPCSPALSEGGHGPRRLRAWEM